ncbi:unnamed protein product [Adineta steineri]|uniref:Major facilitator superfamily (MFS) profile domain-containing protein n=1 Tax=Adineta steineri TaxID=433720 RepID=A0A815B6A7_9BILA|nr:unnamed protein product [Adineta steineri]
MSGEDSEIESIHTDINKNNLQVDQIDINRSLSSLATTGISLDNILRKCGDFGRFQILHYIFMNWISMSFGIISFYYVFGAAEPDHRCRLPNNIWLDDTQYNPINHTHELYINNYIPKTKDGKTWEKCIVYKIENQTNTLINCPNGWIYDRSIFGYTFTEEANFVCQNKSHKSWLATALQFSGFSLLIIGSLADKYGRKKMTVIVTIVLFLTCLITQIIMQWIPMTVNTKFIILLLNQFASGLITANYSLVFILMLELTSSAHTSFAGNLSFISYTIGEVIITLFAYLTRHWQLLKWANLIFIALGIPYLYFMPESPLYMYAKRRYNELEHILRRIANQNGRQETDWYSYYQDFLQNQPKKSSRGNTVTSFQQSVNLLTNRKTIIKLLITSLIGFTTTLIYFQISYGLAALDISPYLGILLGAVVEAAGYITSSVLISTRLGRKGSFIIMMSLTILCILLIPIITKYNSIATIFIAQFGKYSISGTTAITWIFVPELFPTSIRSTANGFFLALCRFGAILTPILNASVSKEYTSYTFYASSILALIVVLFSLLLPETKGKPMDDVPDYSRNRTDI